MGFLGLKDCEIILTNPSNIYYPGQIVKGQVKLTLDAPKTIRGIIIRFIGEAKTRWRRDYYHETAHRRTHHSVRHMRGYEQFIMRQYYMIGGKRSKEQLPAGIHTYPFTLDLPDVLPSSFESRIGNIRYTIKVIVERPWRLNQENSIRYTVISPTDYTDNARLTQPLKHTLEKSFFCFRCESGPLKVITILPQSGYVPGQIIPITCEIDNKSHVKLREVKYALRKLVTFYTNNPRMDRRRSVTKIAEVSTKPVEPHTSVKFEKQIEIPETPPNITNCKIITLGYDLQVQCFFVGPRGKVTGNIPIFLGSKRMYSTLLVGSRGFWNVTDSKEGATYPNASPPKLSFKLLKKNQSLCNGVAWRIPQVLNVIKLFIFKFPISLH